MEIKRARVPKVNDTGIAEDKISFTDLFTYFNEGPRSPLIYLLM